MRIVTSGGQGEMKKTMLRISKFEKRLLACNNEADGVTLGMFTFNSFNITLNNKKDLPSTSSNFSSTFIHEYIHYLQSVSTYYFIKFHQSRFCNFLCEVNTMRDELKDSGSISVPIMPEKVNLPLSNRQYNDFESYIRGDTTPFECFDRCDVELSSAGKELELGCPPIEGLTVEIPMVYLKPHNGKKKRIQLGAMAIAESMANIAETILFNCKNMYYPYSAAYHLAKTLCPDVLANPIVLFACCDVSLMFPNPGFQLYELLLWISKKKNVKAMDYHIVYDNSLKWMVEKSTGDKESYLDFYKNSCNDITKIVSGFIDAINPGASKLLNNLFQKGCMLREQKPSFITDAVANDSMNELIQQFNIPMVMYDKQMFTNYTNDDAFTLFALSSVYEIIHGISKECKWLDFCKKANSEAVEDEKFDHDFSYCSKYPWKNVVYTHCPFADVWNPLFGSANVKNNKE